MAHTLADILKKSKAIMNHDSLMPKTESLEKPNPEFSVPKELRETLNIDNSQLTTDAIMNSNLPDIIKEGMINYPINVINPYDVTQNPDYKDLLEDSQPKPTNRQPTNIVTEEKSFGLSEATIRLIIKDEISKALKSIKTPTINENQIKNSLINLIKEGKLTINKK